MATTATRWAWDALAACRHRVESPHKLTLLAAADLLDRTSARCDRDMFHPDVLALTVAGFTADALAASVGVTAQTAKIYCRQLVTFGLLDSRDGKHFTLPRHAWTAAADPT